MRWLVTGASGFVGSRVVTTLRDKGYTVTATDVATDSDRTSCDTIQDIIHADLSDYSTCVDLTSEVDVVVHLAGEVNPYSHVACQDMANNLKLSANIFNAAVESGVKRIIFISSVWAMIGDPKQYYGGNAVQPDVIPFGKDGKLPNHPGTPYGWSKVISERILDSLVAMYSDLAAVSFRLPMVLSPELGSSRRKSTCSPPTPLELEKRNQIKSSELFSWISRNDAARLISVTAERMVAGHRIYFPVSKTPRSKETQQELWRKYYRDVAMDADYDLSSGLVDISALKQDFGWEPQD
jgi:nucleoside-diphosphate-sugar epimerase